MSEPLKIRGGSLFILAAIVIVAAGLKSSQALVVPFFAVRLHRHHRRHADVLAAKKKACMQVLRYLSS